MDHLLRVVDAYCAATNRAESTVSTLFFGAGHRVRQLRDGADMGVRRVARAMAKFDAEWPADARWPAGVPRPSAKLCRVEAAAEDE